MKKRLLIGLGIAALVFGGVGSVNALLIDQGDGTIFDNVSGLYWQQEIGLWDNMTYDQQISDIDQNFVGWHMALLSEMESLWANTPQTLLSIFNENYPDMLRARFDRIAPPINGHPTHYFGYSTVHSPTHSYNNWALDSVFATDTDSHDSLGAWVVYNSAPVPEPATMLLFGAGIVGLAGTRLRKRDKQPL